MPQSKNPLGILGISAYSRQQQPRQARGDSFHMTHTFIRLPFKFTLKMTVSAGLSNLSGFACLTLGHEMSKSSCYTKTMILDSVVSFANTGVSSGHP